MARHLLVAMATAALIVIGSADVCLDTCVSSNNGVCEDGGEGSVNSYCTFGTDCTDCRARVNPNPDNDLSLIRTGGAQTIPSILCGQTVSAYINGDAHFEPFMLDLRGRATNTRITLDTCSSPVRDPDLCLYREYIDDDQIDTSQGTGDCPSRPGGNNPEYLGEYVSYVLYPEEYPIQLGTYTGKIGRASCRERV